MPQLDLSDSVTSLPFVGAKYANRLKRLEIKTVRDLLYHFPFRYEEYGDVKTIRDLVPGEKAVILGEVVKIESVRTKGWKFLTKAAVADATGAIEVTWFNQPYLTRTIKKGTKLRLAGKVEAFGRRLSLISPEFETTRTSADPAQRGWPLHTASMVPIYPETGKVSSKWLRARISNVLENIPLDGGDVEFLPEDIRESEELLPWGKALKLIHFPKDKEEAKAARRRFAFEELFLLNLRACVRRESWGAKRLAKKIVVSGKRPTISQFINSLPFKLTQAQRRVVGEVLADLDKSAPMNRLLEGDVGSGKTVIAAVAAYTCFLSGTRAVLMAPTEILAQQHYSTLKELLAPYGINCVLHTGSRKLEHKKLSNQPINQSTSQPVDLWIGTHALFYRSGNFENIGLVVIDEQHRFGVAERAKLLKRAEAKGTPHLLTLTATPIPRSLALTVYGDLDLSILDELPPGRKRVRTHVVPEEKREAGYRWIADKVKSGEQAFIICPLIEESEVESMKQVKAAAAEYEKLQNKVFPDLHLGLLHGRLKSDEKEEVINRFREGKYHILVSTPVVEVGIDIPNATIMVIETAERFGLASLHQLRGRVGRGDKESYCFLFAENAGRRIYRRLKALETTASGFKLAELDLKLRGPGELYGTKQHGLTELKVADLTDAKLLKKVRDYATEIAERGLSAKLEEEIEQISGGPVEPN